VAFNHSSNRSRVVEALPNYEIGAEIGRGGCGVVLHGRHRILDREVAIKQLPVAFGADTVVRARFVEEARLVAKLDHPHIAPVYDFVEHDGMCLILMEFLPGGTLWQRYEQQAVRADEACAFILAAASALEHAHGYGVIHRDIKPDNFLLDDRPGVIKLSDFGIAKVLGGAAMNLTAVDQIIGTAAYMAPEQVLSKPVTAATDVYACATMLFEFLARRLPYEEFPDDPLRQMMVKVDGPRRRLLDVEPAAPVEVAAVVDRALADAPADRPATASEFGAQLAEAATRDFGVGWLRRSGVHVNGSSHLISITERITRPAVAAVPAGWFPDPMHQHAHRWWDGREWTAHVAD
jgi:serine/threonine protein kinase